MREKAALDAGLVLLIHNDVASAVFRFAIVDEVPAALVIIVAPQTV